jgi:FKBP-type peptidyl-prolyl cis-trans isomerase
MIAVSLLAGFWGLPGMEALHPVDLLVGDEFVAVDTKIGDGETPVLGQTLTASFTLTDGLGRVLADSEQRGLPFSFRYGSPDVDPLLGAAVEEMRIGSERRVVFSPDFLPNGIGGIVPPKTDLILRVRLER